MSVRREIVVAADVGEAAGALIAGGIADAVAAGGRCRLAIPGGTGPIPVFAWLAANLDPALAAATVVTWVDERHAAGPEDSNRQLAWDRWLSRTLARPAELVLDAPGSLGDALHQVSAGFAALGGLDVVLLGVGPDGHVASLFPGHPALDLPGPVLAVDDSPKPPPERLTLSMPVLCGAELAVVVAAGVAKAAVIAAAAGQDPRAPDALPVARVTARGRCVWVLDPAASAGLSGR